MISDIASLVGKQITIRDYRTGAYNVGQIRDAKIVFGSKLRLSIAADRYEPVWFEPTDAELETCK